MMHLTYDQPITRSVRSIWLFVGVFGLLIFPVALAAQSAEPNSVVVATYPISPPSALALRMVIAPCKKNRCTVYLQLVKDEKPIHQLPLKWEADTQDAEQQQVGYDAGHGVGDPLDESGLWQSWVLGQSEENSVSIIVQPVTLADGVAGFAVNQTAGFEHVKRHHAIYVVTGGTLRLAWEYTEAAGPYWSKMVSPVNANGARELVMLSGLRSSAGNAVDTLDVGYLSWDPKTTKVQKKGSGHTLLYYVVVSPFDEISKARAFKQSHSECLAGFSLLHNEVNGKALPSSVAFVAVTHMKSLAEQAREKVSTCFSVSERVRAEVF